MDNGFVAKNAIEKLLSFLPHLSDKSIRPLAHSRSDSMTQAFFTALDTTGFTIQFDYNAWLKESGMDINDKNALERCDLETLRKIVTAHIRQDRFLGGHLQQLLDDGYFLSLLNALSKFA